jgi:predicted O-methyltransferase YrrM
MEIGVRSGVSTSALLAGIEEHGGKLYSFDINNCDVFRGASAVGRSPTSTAASANQARSSNLFQANLMCSSWTATTPMKVL